MDPILKQIAKVIISLTNTKRRNKILQGQVGPSWTMVTSPLYIQEIKFALKMGQEKYAWPLYVCRQSKIYNYPKVYFQHRLIIENKENGSIYDLLTLKPLTKIKNKTYVSFDRKNYDELGDPIIFTLEENNWKKVKENLLVCADVAEECGYTGISKRLKNIANHPKNFFEFD